MTKFRLLVIDLLILSFKNVSKNLEIIKKQDKDTVTFISTIFGFHDLLNEFLL